MKEESFYEIGDDGSYAVTITRRAIHFGDKLAEQFQTNITRKISNIRVVGGIYGGCGVALMKNGFNLWSTRVKKLPLRTFFNTESGIVVPVFDNADCTHLELIWEVPADMWLCYCVTVIEGAPENHQMEAHHLVAADSKGQLYKLPVSNLHSDGKLCHGMDRIANRTSWEVVQLCLNTFEKSNWNADLYSGNEVRRENTKELFRFEPKDGGFKQLPSTAHWTRLSAKLGNELIQGNLIWNLI